MITIKRKHNRARKDEILLDTRWGNGSEISRRDFLKRAAIAASFVITVSLVGVPAACAPKTATLPGQGANEVWISGGKIYPEILTAAIGTTVTWIYKVTKAHTVTSDATIFEGSLPPGGSFSYTFTEHKNYGYRCATHPRMKGVIFVEPDIRTNCDDCHA